MSANNGDGIIKIGNQGIVKFQFGDDNGPMIALDVLLTNDCWAELDWSFRDADGKLIDGKIAEWRLAKIAFFRKVITDAAAGQSQDMQQMAAQIAGSLNYAQVNRFQDQIRKECEKLKPFFSEGTGSEQSPPASSAKVTYSE